MTIRENYNIEMALLKMQTDHIFEILIPEQKEEYNIKIKELAHEHMTEISKYVPREDIIGWWRLIRHLD